MNHIASSAHSLAKHFLAFLFILLCTGGLYAQLGTLSVQGVLTKADGTAVDDGTYSLKFALWKNQSSTNPVDRVHEETLSVETTGGVYSTILGLNTPFGPSATFADVYYLGVTFGSSELLPRPRLTAAPYAMGLLGGSNIIAGAGNITVDGVLSDSYGFKSSPTSGMFWSGETNFKHAGTTRLLIGSNGSNYFTGATFFNAGTQTTGRVSTNDGFGFQSGGTPFSTGLFFDTKDRATIYTDGTVRFHAWNDGKNYYRATNGHVFDVGGITVGNSGSLLVTGQAHVYGKMVTNDYFGGGGYTFFYPGTNFWDNDSGIFGGGDGIVQILSNGTRVAEFSQVFPTNEDNENSWSSTSVKLWNLQRGPDRKNVQWDPATGRLYWDNSSRRFKSNITPLVDDFTKILQVQPKTYDRPESKGDWEIGYIAEEIDSLGLHRVVEYTNGIVDGVNYEKMILYAIEVLKIQHAEVEKLKAEVATLTAEKNALRTENTSLRAVNAALQTNQSEFSAQLNALSKRMQAMETLTGNR